MAAAVLALGVAPVTARPPTAGPAEGTANRTPTELQGAGIDDHLGQTIPLDLEFTDSTGKTVTLRDYFVGDRPVLLNMVYFECPMLCTMALTGTLDAVKGVEWTAGGEEYTIVTVSFNPKEGPDLASEKRANYLKEYGRDVTANGDGYKEGVRLAGGTDFTGDGIPDVLVGVPGDDPNGRRGAGSVRVISANRTTI